jgi:hypothetical protein
MKILTPDEIREMVTKFSEAMEEERLLQEELLQLRIYGDIDQVKRGLARQDEIFAKINEIRDTKMMPILEELARFIGECQKLEAEGKIPKIEDFVKELEKEKAGG